MYAELTSAAMTLSAYKTAATKEIRIVLRFITPEYRSWSNGPVTCPPATYLARCLPSNLTATQSPNPLEVFVSGHITPVTAIGVCEVAASGGTPPYTYTWTVLQNIDEIEIQGIDNVFAVKAAGETIVTGYQATFRKQQLGRNETAQGSFRCTVTDSAGTPLTYTLPTLTVRLVKSR